MPTPLDFALIILIAVVWTVYEHYLAWPRFLKRLSTGDPRARVRTYMSTFAKEWFLAGLLVATWAGQHHPWSALPLAVPSAGRLTLGLALCAAVAVVLGLQARAVGKISDKTRYRARLASVEPILPHTSKELRWFFTLSVTAGVCEEWIFRGVLTTLLAAWIGLPVAVLLANVAFGLAHSYQGASGIVKTGAGGLVMSGIVLATGWLVPAMIIHALVDLGSGRTAYVLLSGDDGKTAQAA